MTVGLPERLLKKRFGAVPFLCGQKLTKGEGKVIESGLAGKLGNLRCAERKI